jgi:hypothetical protein
MTVSAPLAFPLGPGQAIDNLTGLPNLNLKGLGHVGAAATGYIDAIVAPIFVRTAASGVSPTGTIRLFVVVAEEILTPSRFTDGIDPDAATNQISALGQATAGNQVDAITGGANGLQASTSYCFQGFSIKGYLGYTPTFWALAIMNGSGAQLSAVATTHYARYTLIT